MSDSPKTVRPFRHRQDVLNSNLPRGGNLKAAKPAANGGFFLVRNRVACGPALYSYAGGNVICDPEIRFSGRSRRPPLDPVNALLSFLYTLLTHDCRSAAEGVGLDPAVGFLHRDRPGRPSLALDLMEELRPILADRLVLSLLNRRQLRFSPMTGAASS